MNGHPLTHGTWLIVIIARVSLGFASCAEPNGSRASTEPQGHPRFELLGMLDEYAGRRLDDADFIERFYPAEVAVADHFEAMLGELCADESLPKDWRRTMGEAGHITFSGSRIAAAINRSYSVDTRYGCGLYRVGVLAPSVMRSASRADLLRYVVGAYIRYGDCDGRLQNPQSAHRAFFGAANNYSKFCVLTDFLPRLGCTHLRSYDDHESAAVPTAAVLTFTPSDEVKALTGIRREITPQEIKARSSSLKEAKLPHF